jgi:hypothetical protein
MLSQTRSAELNFGCDNEGSLKFGRSLVAGGSTTYLGM